MKPGNHLVNDAISTSIFEKKNVFILTGLDTLHVSLSYISCENSPPIDLQNSFFIFIFIFTEFLFYCHGLHIALILSG